MLEICICDIKHKVKLSICDIPAGFKHRRTEVLLDGYIWRRIISGELYLCTGPYTRKTNFYEALGYM